MHHQKIYCINNWILRLIFENSSFPISRWLFFTNGMHHIMECTSYKNFLNSPTVFFCFSINFQEFPFNNVSLENVGILNNKTILLSRFILKIILQLSQSLTPMTDCIFHCRSHFCICLRETFRFKTWIPTKIRLSSWFNYSSIRSSYMKNAFDNIQ